jgi:predicted nucleic acid-binding protein
MPPSKVLVDTSFLVALFVQDAREFESVSEIADLYKGRLLVPQVVLTEAAYMIRREISVMSAVPFLRELAGWGSSLLELDNSDLRRVSDIMEQYASANFDFVDCCLMALSERLNIRVILTPDRRDFTIFRPQHINYLRILPEE